MLVIKSLHDLLKYLETRKAFFEKTRQTILKEYGRTKSPTDAGSNESGIIYAFEEAIRAVQALIEFQKNNPVHPIGDYKG